MRQVILNFHGIGTPGRPMEPGEAPYWVSEAFFEETLALAMFHKDRTRTDFTFDDGNLSDLEIALPALARHKMQATFFILADRIGATGSLSAADIRALALAGHRIGSHGAAHVDWKATDRDTLERELGPTTREAIARAAGRPVNTAAIPFGRYDARVLRALARQGYESIYSSDGGPWRPGQWPIPRTSPRADMTLNKIENVLTGNEPAMVGIRRRLARSVKRLI